MNDATRHDNATIDATHKTETQAQLRDRLGINPRTMQRRWLATFGASFCSQDVATPEQIATMEAVFSGQKVEVVSKPMATKTAQIVVESTADDEVKASDTDQIQAPNKAYVYLPLIAASVASIKNMWLICYHLSDGDMIASIALTAVFAGSAMSFILSNMSGPWLKAVVYLLLIFEAFTNTTGVYYGLLGRTGAPTRFLGMVTDILQSGTHWTAIGLGVAMAILIGAVQIISIKSLIK